MRRGCVAAGVALLCVASVWAQDPNDSDREFRRLLARDDAVMAAGKEPHAGNVASLEHAYRRFLSANPTRARAMTAFGSFLNDTGREAEAVQWCERAIAADPREAGAYNELAGHYGHDGRPGDALRLYDKAIALKPGEAMYRSNWAVTCSLFRIDAQRVYGWDEREVFQRSLEQFRQARNLAPREFSFAKAYAEEFYMTQPSNWDAARAAWTYCLDLPLTEDERQGVYGHLARVSIRLRDVAGARGWLDKINSEAMQSQRRALEKHLAQLADK